MKTNPVNTIIAGGEFLSSRDPLLMILVGESGAGKSAFCDFVDRPEGYFCSSEAIGRKLEENGQPINHDTVHAFANRAYGENPEWQVPNILGKLATRRFLILDGPRRLAEVEALKRNHPNTVIVRLTAPKEDRYIRLQERDGVDVDAFDRIINDERSETELGQILAMADQVIDNSKTLEEFKQKALKVQHLLDSLEEAK
jgi:dephospho-CoA kinase